MRHSRRVIQSRTYALAFLVALSLALLQGQTCDRGNTDLTSLELEVDGGPNLIVGFDTLNRSYDVSTSGSTVTVRAQAVFGVNTITWQWLVGTTTIGSGPIGTGSGEVTLPIPIPDGQSVLRIVVRSNQVGTTASGYYGVNVDATNACATGPDGTACSLEYGAAGWCIQGTCQISSLCPAGKCADGKECTQDSCDPADGTCSFVPYGDFPECGGGGGICVDDECISKTQEPCLRVGFGRINCCAVCAAYASECVQLLEPGSSCDPTGREPPDPTRSQAGHCSALGECIWDAGHPDAGRCLDEQPCFDSTENADYLLDTNDCTARWCDPALGCRDRNLTGTFPCNDGGGTCIGSDLPANRLLHGRSCTYPVLPEPGL